MNILFVVVALPLLSPCQSLLKDSQNPFDGMRNIKKKTCVVKSRLAHGGCNSSVLGSAQQQCMGAEIKGGAPIFVTPIRGVALIFVTVDAMFVAGETQNDACIILTKHCMTRCI